MCILSPNKKIRQGGFFHAPIEIVTGGPLGIFKTEHSIDTPFVIKASGEESLKCARRVFLDLP
jgi:hypothetical protein